ncbi:GlcG/HbpS family heme-binding protein [Arthrobacter ramosus]|uniref:Heme-binding protein n=1 Tax=Arthrobacter ramosus TaxID=1672 RepID=A0ABV5XVX6_ARTRM|nr:heme-binding protein [Arthrobacter ramosus]
MPKKPAPQQRHVRVLSYDEARLVLDAALARAKEISVPASVAVLDAGRELLAFGRHDLAPLLTGEVARAKAYTSGSLRQPSGALLEPTRPGGDFYGLQHGSDHALITFAGGMPLFDGKDLVGSVGASGGSVEEDTAIAQAAVEAFEGMGK